MHTGDIRGIAAATRLLMMHWAKTWFQLPRVNADGETTGQRSSCIFHVCFSWKCEVKRNECHPNCYWWNSTECWWKRNNVLFILSHNKSRWMCICIFKKVMLMFKSIHACAGLKMDQRLTCTHYCLLMGMRAAAQSHRQPVKLFEGRTNVIPQLYQSHRWALGFITDQEGKTGKQEGDCGRGQLI